MCAMALQYAVFTVPQSCNY